MRTGVIRAFLVLAIVLLALSMYPQVQADCLEDKLLGWDGKGCGQGASLTIQLSGGYGPFSVSVSVNFAPPKYGVAGGIAGNYDSCRGKWVSIGTVSGRKIEGNSVFAGYEFKQFSLTQFDSQDVGNQVKYTAKWHVKIHAWCWFGLQQWDEEFDLHVVVYIPESAL